MFAFISRLLYLIVLVWVSVQFEQLCIFFNSHVTVAKLLPNQQQQQQNRPKRIKQSNLTWRYHFIHYSIKSYSHKFIPKCCEWLREREREGGGRLQREWNVSCDLNQLNVDVFLCLMSITITSAYIIDIIISSLFIFILNVRKPNKLKCNKMYNIRQKLPMESVYCIYWLNLWKCENVCTNYKSTSCL